MIIILNIMISVRKYDLMVIFCNWGKGLCDLLIYLVNKIYLFFVCVIDYKLRNVIVSCMLLFSVFVILDIFSFVIWKLMCVIDLKSFI